ncbi:MAG: arginine deiminase-related protein, partial [Steroidobacteraceae bacterium]
MIEPQCSSDAAPERVRQTQQCAPAVLLVRPARFGYNPQTAHSNRFQRDALRAESSEAQVLVEFESLRSALHSAGVRQCVAFDTHEPIKPDAVFPNNWVSF